jgi:hypothetical protein
MTLRGQPGAPYFVEPIDEHAPALVEWEGGWNTFDDVPAARTFVSDCVENGWSGHPMTAEDFTIANNG